MGEKSVTWCEDKKKMRCEEYGRLKLMSNTTCY